MFCFFIKIKKNTWRYYFTPAYQKSWWYDHDRLKLVIFGHFLPFYPPKTLKMQKLDKMKNLAGDIIILHMCTKNHNHMMYGS